ELEEVALDLAVGPSGRLPVLISARVLRDGADRHVETRMILVRAAGRRNYERDLQGREAEAIQHLNDEKSTAVIREQFIAVLGHARGRVRSARATQRKAAPVGPLLRQVATGLDTSQPPTSFVCDRAADDPVSADPARLGPRVSNPAGNSPAHAHPPGPTRLTG